jgi:predicted amidohydrolase
VLLDRLRQCAVPVNGPSLRRIAGLARLRRMHVVVGFAEQGPDGCFHNSAALFDSSGELMACYRKIHCRDFERIDHGGGFTPGDQFVVRRLRLRSVEVPMGLMICFDREVTETVRCLRAMGAVLVACPLACDTTRLAAHGNHADNEMITRCRAAENELFIAVVNHARRFNGGSFVVGPGGEEVMQLGAGEAVAVVDLPVGGVHADFHSRPLGWMGWGYRRPEVYRRVNGLLGSDVGSSGDA